MASLLDLLKRGGDDGAAETAETTTPAGGDAASAARLDAVKKKAAKGGRRAADLAAQLRDQAQHDALNELFEGENWQEIAGLYFDARFVVTGDACFELAENKKRVLGLTLAKAMKTLTVIDPAYLAVGMFLVHFGGTIAACEMVHAQNVKRLAARQEAAAGHRPVQ